MWRMRRRGHGAKTSSIRDPGRREDSQLLGNPGARVQTWPQLKGLLGDEKTANLHDLDPKELESSNRIHHIPWDVLVRAPVLLFPNNFRSWIEAYAMAGDKWKWFSDLVQEQLQDPVLADFTTKYARELFSAHPSSAKFNQASVSSGLSGR
jgi:hypothetical protein